MVDRHVSHEKDKAYPWHEWTIYIFGDQVCSSGADEERADATPKIEEANEVEQRDPRSWSDSLRQKVEYFVLRYYEKILLVWFGIRNALQDSSERVGQQEREDELY